MATTRPKSGPAPKAPPKRRVVRSTGARLFSTELPSGMLSGPEGGEPEGGGGELGGGGAESGSSGEESSGGGEPGGGGAESGSSGKESSGSVGEESGGDEGEPECDEPPPPPAHALRNR
jgi:hypothetical protein